MIFNEIYSTYYNVVATIITELIKNDVSELDINKLVKDKAFSESILSIIPALKSEKWQLVCSDMTTPIKHVPTMPLTEVQKRWLKAISLDRRMQLFEFSPVGLDDVEPLFDEEDYCIFDKYGDGDPYNNKEYVEKFRFILKAIKSKSEIKLTMYNKKGQITSIICLPIRLEYSEKDDKFRLIAKGNIYNYTINLSRIITCEKYEGTETIGDNVDVSITMDNILVKVVDERNTLERFMLHFAHFEKRAKRIGENQYVVRIFYNRNDETEMVIRVLSFGPTVEVVESEAFRQLIVERLKKQKRLGL